MRWDEFARACPQIAGMAEQRFGADRLVMLGTLRLDGSPRISPCEVEVVSGQLVLGMIWRSRKALDLVRDARVTVHSATCRPEGTDGDIKLYGRAHESADIGLRRSYQRQVEEKLQWRPPGPRTRLRRRCGGCGLRRLRRGWLRPRLGRDAWPPPARAAGGHVTPSGSLARETRE
jgi:hypothetical protein